MERCNNQSLMNPELSNLAVFLFQEDLYIVLRRRDRQRPWETRLCSSSADQRNQSVHCASYQIKFPEIAMNDQFFPQLTERFSLDHKFSFLFFTNCWSSRRCVLYPCSYNTRYFGVNNVRCTCLFFDQTQFFQSGVLRFVQFVPKLTLGSFCFPSASQASRITLQFSNKSCFRSNIHGTCLDRSGLPVSEP